MAARVYQDNLPKTNRQREFGLIDAGNGFYNLPENPEALEVIGSKFGKSNAMGDMSLECNASASGTTVTISHPSGVPAQIWFDAPKVYSSADTYLFKSGDADPVPLIMLDSAGEELSDEAFKNSRVGAFLKQTPEGLCAFFKTGGGGGLNFSVVGGTAQPSNPKENTIWIETDTPVSGWVFASTEPDSPAAGQVWIKTGSSSAAAFNALKKNVLVVYPLAGYQYTTSGTWDAMPTQIYQNGVWKEPVTLYLDGDNLYGGITSGYSVVSKPSGAYLDPQFTSAGIVLTTTSYMCVSVATNGMVDLTDINTLRFYVSVSGRNSTTSYAISVGANSTRSAVYSTNSQGWSAEYLGSNTGNGTYIWEVDTSHLSGEFYILAIATSGQNVSGTCTISKIEGA